MPYTTRVLPPDEWSKLADTDLGAVLSGVEDIGTGALGTIGNVIWFVIAGIWLAIGHIAAALCCFITIIGIPFGIQHLKLAALTLAPVGKTIVAKNAARVGN